MNQEELTGAKDFEEWMKQEDERKKNHVFIDEPIKEKIPIKELPKINKQLNLF